MYTEEYYCKSVACDYIIHIYEMVLHNQEENKIHIPSCITHNRFFNFKKLRDVKTNMH